MDSRVLWFLSKKFSPLLILCGIGWIILAAPIPDSNIKLFPLILGESLALFVFYIWGFTSFYTSHIMRRVLQTLPISRRTLCITVCFGSIGIPFLLIFICVSFTILFFYFSYGMLPSHNLVPAILISVLLFNLTYSTTIFLYTKNFKKISFALLLLTFMVCLGIWTPWNFEIPREFFYRHRVFSTIVTIASLILSVYSAKESKKIPPIDFLQFWKPIADKPKMDRVVSPIWRKIRCNPFFKAVFFSFILSVIASFLLIGILVLNRFIDTGWDIDILYRKYFMGRDGIIILVIATHFASQSFLLSLRNFAVLPVTRKRIFIYCCLFPLIVVIPYTITIVFTFSSETILISDLLSFLSLYCSVYLFFNILFLYFRSQSPFIWSCLMGFFIAAFLDDDIFSTSIGHKVGLGALLILLLSLWYSLHNYKQPFSINPERHAARMSGVESL